MALEQDFIDAINADPKNITLQLVYADWLEEQGNPLAEAWRVLVERKKEPYPLSYSGTWLWTWVVDVGDRHNLKDMFSRFPSNCSTPKATFFGAMSAAATGWLHQKNER